MSDRDPKHWIHWSELPAAQPGNPLATELETYRREVGRLLAEGHEGRHILIKDDQILGIWETDKEAIQEAYRRFLVPGESFFVHQIQSYERLIRVRAA